jgi:hypothetical protein
MPFDQLSLYPKFQFLFRNLEASISYTLSPSCNFCCNFHRNSSFDFLTSCSQSFNFGKHFFFRFLILFVGGRGSLHLNLSFFFVRWWPCVVYLLLFQELPFILNLNLRHYYLIYFLSLSSQDHLKEQDFLYVSWQKCYQSIYLSHVLSYCHVTKQI